MLPARRAPVPVGGRAADADLRPAEHVATVVRHHAAGLDTGRHREAVAALDESFGDAVLAAGALARAGRHDESVRVLLDIAPRAARHHQADAVASALEGWGRVADLDLAHRAEALCRLAVLRAQQPEPSARAEVVERLRAGLELAAHLDAAAQCSVLLIACSALDVVDDPAMLLRAAATGLTLADSTGDRGTWGRFAMSAAACRQRLDDTVAATADAWAAHAVAYALDDTFLGIRSALVLHRIQTTPYCGPLPLPDLPDLMASAARAGDDYALGTAANAMAGRALARGCLREAAASTDIAFAAARRLGSWALDGAALATLVALLVAAGDAPAAARFHAAVARVLPLPALTPSQLASYERAVDHARTILRDGLFQQEVGRGAAMSWSAAVELAQAQARRLARGPATGDRTAAVAASATAPVSLTVRELEVLTMLARGYTDKEAAQRLGLRPKTVMHHNESIYKKLGVRGRAGAVSTALRLGLLAGT